jgi:hypothetical protein
MLCRNSVIGAGAALDQQIALNTAIGQADSAGTAIEASVLKQAARDSEIIRVALAQQEHMLVAQTQQVAACNALHELEERLSSRWSPRRGFLWTAALLSPNPSRTLIPAH